MKANETMKFELQKAENGIVLRRERLIKMHKGVHGLNEHQYRAEWDTLVLQDSDDVGAEADGWIIMLQKRRF